MYIESKKTTTNCCNRSPPKRVKGQACCFCGRRWRRRGTGTRPYPAVSGFVQSLFRVCSRFVQVVLLAVRGCSRLIQGCLRLVQGLFKLCVRVFQVVHAVLLVVQGCSMFVKSLFAQIWACLRLFKVCSSGVFGCSR